MTEAPTSSYGGMAGLGKGFNLAFFEEADLAFERDKIAFIRPILGAIITWRFWRILALSPDFDGLGLVDAFSQARYWALLVLVLAAVLFTLGMFATIANALLLAGVMWVDQIFATGTLGSCIAILLLAIMLAGDSGRRFSFDASLRPKRRPAFVGERRYREYQLIYWVLFLSYAELHLLAFTYHLWDPAWVQGWTSYVIFTNSYLCRFFEVFRAIEATNRTALVVVSSTISVIQSIWQFGMIPFAITMVGRPFVAFWGWVFIISSLLFLQLSYLAPLEILLWIILFLRRDHFKRLTARCVGETPEVEDRDGRGKGNVSRFVLGYCCVWVAAIAIYGMSFLHNRYGELSGRRFYPVQVDVDIAKVSYYFGLWAPNVFNRTDLKMGDCWFVIHRLEGEALPRLVPMNGLAGERLGFHSSDRVYFGVSAPWRRHMIDRDVVQECKPGASGYRWIEQIVQLDANREGVSGNVEYRIDIYRNHASDYESNDLANKYAAVREYSFSMPAPGDRTRQSEQSK